MVAQSGKHVRQSCTAVGAVGVHHAVTSCCHESDGCPGSDALHRLCLVSQLTPLICERRSREFCSDLSCSSSPSQEICSRPALSHHEISREIVRGRVSRRVRWKVWSGLFTLCTPPGDVNYSEARLGSVRSASVLLPGSAWP